MPFPFQTVRLCTRCQIIDAVTGGTVNVYVTFDTHVVRDINGRFAGTLPMRHLFLSELVGPLASMLLLTPVVLDINGYFSPEPRSVGPE